MSGNCEPGRGLRTREKNATEGGAGRLEKPAPDARAAPPEAHESLISRKTGTEVPLTGLSAAQLVLAYPFTIFLARLLGRPWNEGGADSLLAHAFGLARAAADTFGLTAFIPTWLADAFASPGTTLVLLAFCLVTVVCQSPGARIGGTVALMLVPLAVACAQPPFPSRSFLVGLGCMVAGMGLQYANVTKYYRDRTILDRLRHVTDEAARRASLRLITRAWWPALEILIQAI